MIRVTSITNDQQVYLNEDQIIEVGDAPGTPAPCFITTTAHDGAESTVWEVHESVDQVLEMIAQARRVRIVKQTTPVSYVYVGSDGGLNYHYARSNNFSSVMSDKKAAQKPQREATR